ncbi:hypothetical protein E2C01_091553 [Portunus trituberculatus]|uniref:Uncharacterized protein n=1 Tax=Portunus trituberculatus TaxID=210409 RepID=A0A5B7JJC5_PORTR|nr:hypothetical protein [Portunus trituberculatus]
MYTAARHAQQLTPFPPTPTSPHYSGFCCPVTFTAPHYCLNRRLLRLPKREASCWEEYYLRNTHNLTTRFETAPSLTPKTMTSRLHVLHRSLTRRRLPLTVIHASLDPTRLYLNTLG